MIGIIRRNPKYLFWKWFAKNSSIFFKQFESNPNYFLDQINAQLKAIDPNFICEISVIKDGRMRELTISANGIEDSFDNVIELCNLAPRIKNWEVVCFRQRIQNDNISIVYTGIKLSYPDIFFNYENKGDHLDLNVYISNYNNNEEAYLGAYFILLDCLIGEYNAVRKIGNTKIQEFISGEENRLHKFIQLRSVVDSI